jgi:hypothetical protein
MGSVAQRQRNTLKANESNVPDEAFQSFKVRGISAGCLVNSDLRWF